MVEGDFIREVDEELRRERLKQLWDRYGTWVLLGALTIIAAVAGHQLWQSWKASQAAEAGARYERALALVADSKINEAEAAFRTIAEEGTAGYRTLARLQLAGLAAREGRPDEAVKLYDEIAEGGADDALRDYARLRAAMLRLGVAPRAEIDARIGPLLEAQNPWRHAAREVAALAAWKAGDTVAARRHLSANLGDPGTPRGLRQRANLLLELIVSVEAKGKRGVKGADARGNGKTTANGPMTDAPQNNAPKTE